MKTTYILISFLLAASAPEITHAQLAWKKITTFPERVSVIYFYDDDLGFIATGTVPGSKVTVSAAIYRTVDGGTTWTRSATPSGSGFGVNEIIMENTLNGWALSDHNAGRVWSTRNGGITWELVSTPTDGGSHLGNSIRRTSQGVVVTDFLAGTIELSQDEGRTFRNVYKVNDNILGMDFVDSVHGVAAAQFRNRSNKWVFTSDGGLTWHPSNYGTESWTVRGRKGTSIFIATPEGYSDINDYLTEVMRSDDYGMTWRKITSLPFRSASDVQFSGEALYVQTGPSPCPGCTYPDGYGIYRSLDSGKTWRGIGGPDYWADTRFGLVHDCKGTIIICADKDNNIYKAIDTSVRKKKAFDGPNNTFIIPGKFIETSVCKDTQTSVSVLVAECYNLIITSKELRGLDSACFRLSEPAVPVYLSDNGTRFIIKLIEHDTVRDYKTYLHLQGYYQYGPDHTEPFDTLVAVMIRVTPGNQKLVCDRGTVAFKTIEHCEDFQQQTAALVNTGCGPITVTSGPHGVEYPFIVDPVSLPRTLLPGDTLQFHVRFDPDSVKQYLGSALFTAETGLEHQSLHVPLLGSNEFSPPHLIATDSVIDMRNVFLCPGSKDTSIVLMNSGCDPLRITAIRRSKNPYYSFDSVSLPITLAKQEKLTVKINFHPALPGLQTDTVTIVCESNTLYKTTSIALRGTGKASVPKLVSSVMSVDFGIVPLCSTPKDTTIIIRNDGCDTLTLISGPGQVRSPFSTTVQQLPLILPPGSSVNISVRFEPTTIGSFSDMLEYETERYGLRSILIIEIDGMCTPGDGALSVGPDNISFAPLTICANVDSKRGYITNNGCDSIVVTSIVLNSHPQLSLVTRETPFLLAPGDSEQYTIVLTPTFKGIVQAKLTVNAGNMHGAKKTMTEDIPITAEITDGTRLLVCENDTINFGSRILCDEPDTTITLRNRGCDTVTISSIELTGNGFELEEHSLPIHIAPDEKINLRVRSRIDTTNNNQVSFGTLTVVSNSETVTSDVIYSRKYVYPYNTHTALSLSRANATSGDTIAVEISLGNIPADTKEFDAYLSYNQDLLTYVGYESKNSVTFTGGHLNIKYDVALEMPATLYFRATLTSETSTDIDLTSCRLNASDPSYSDCIATISGSTVHFDYESICGDNTLSRYLHNGNIFSINAISPNPLRGNTCDVSISVPEAMSLHIDIVDMNGNTVGALGSMPVPFTKGEHTIKLNTSGLQSGIYHIRLTSDKGAMYVKKVVEVE